MAEMQIQRCRLSQRGIKSKLLWPLGIDGGKNGEARGFLGPLVWAVNEPVPEQERWCASGVLSAN